MVYVVVCVVMCVVVCVMVCAMVCVVGCAVVCVVVCAVMCVMVCVVMCVVVYVVVHVVVCIDHAWHHHVATQVVGLASDDIRLVGAGANPEDLVAVDQYGCIADLAALIIKGGEVIDMVE